MTKSLYCSTNSVEILKWQTDVTVLELSHTRCCQKWSHIFTNDFPLLILLI